MRITHPARHRGPGCRHAALRGACLAIWLGLGCAHAAEVCRFTGTTDHAGHIAVETRVTAGDGATTVDVTARFDASPPLWPTIHYLMEEISTWRGDALARLAVNSRYLVGGWIIRQQWDVFTPGPTGLQGERVEAKTLADFRARHPGFVAHWDPATFGQPWLSDYPAASAQRRRDLDLAAGTLPAGLRSPLALAFYWIRWLPRGGQSVPVFLPGFKADRLVQLPVAATAVPHGLLWRAPLHYPALYDHPPSLATAWTSPDAHLLQLSFELHGSAGALHGDLHQAGCVGAAR